MCSVSYGQSEEELDSLVDVYKKHKEDTAKVNTLSKLIAGYLYRDHVKAKAYTQEQLDLAHTLNYTKGKMKANYYLGVIYNNLDQKDSSRYYYKKSKVYAEEMDDSEAIFNNALGLSILEYAEGNLNEAETITDENLALMTAKNDSLNMAILLDFKGLINQMKGYYSIAYTHSLEALKIYEALDVEIRKADALNHLAGTEHSLKNYKSSIEYNKKALKIYEENGDIYYAAQALNDIGLSFNVMQELDSSMVYLTRSLEKSKEANVPALSAVTLGNMGTVKWHKEQYGEATQLFEQAIAICNTIGDLRRQRETEAKLGVNYNDWNKPMKAIPLFDKVILYASENDVLDMLKNAYEGRSKSYQLLKKYPKAIYDFEQAATLRDTIFNNEKTAKIEELKAVYETEKKEREIELQNNKIELLETKAEVGTLWQWILWAGLAVLGIIFGLTFYSLRQKMKRNELEREKLDTTLAYKEKELTTHTLHLAHKNEVLADLKNQIEEIKKEGGSTRKVQNVLNQINLDINNDGSWEQFRSYFEDVHRDFNTNVKRNYPGISAKELRFMALVKMNLSSKEIANILNISQEGVKKARYRLRKKMALEPSESLEDLILSL
ncbi:MAG: tetratricopeptide repeat protein [Bacteroidota bacterium]